MNIISWIWRIISHIVDLPYRYKLKSFKLHIISKAPKGGITKNPLSRFAMEKRTMVLALMLCLVVGMLAGQSRARKPEFQRCYDTCYARCLTNSMGALSLVEICSNCYENCELKIKGKACFLIWCWNTGKKN